MTKNKVDIIQYNLEHRLRFKEINEQWILSRLEIEEEDIKTFDNPDQYTSNDGGKIFIALVDNYPFGTCAYLYKGDGKYEKIKLAVDENYRRHKIGYKICLESQEAIKNIRAKHIFQFSNIEGCTVAIQLYKKLGFIEVQFQCSGFQRTDTKMKLSF
ncbi:MAG: GNAT family N-acetyltransferase [Saprospiraceae bacterium]|nr:GNAT family N-acetyltransferase [Saprospiraceae bacterium]